MIRWSCPNCSRLLEFSDQLAGLSRTCPDCGETFVLPESAILERSQLPLGPPPPRPEVLGPPPSQPPSPEMRWLKRYAWAVVVPAVAVVAIVAAVLYGVLRTDIWIYVDNGDTQPLEVTIDGSRRTTVAPGTFGLVKCRSGERHIQVRRGEAAVFDEVKQLKPGDKKSVAKYLLNPGLTRRYRTRVVEYGITFQMPNLGLDQTLLGGEAWLKSKYEELAKKPALLDAVPWQEISGCDYVLEKEPEEIEGMIHEMRTVLGRVDKNDYAFLQEARQKRNPTAEDLDALVAVVNRVLQSTP
jgi:hypothetical protein